MQNYTSFRILSIELGDLGRGNRDNSNSVHWKKRKFQMQITSTDQPIMPQFQTSCVGYMK